MDYVKVCLEEIALEGLDGITLQALWLRLEHISPMFPLQLDNATKNFLWSSVICHERALYFYELPESRPPLAIFNRFDYADPETGICVEQENQPADIYPLCMVDDSKRGVTGSCATYNTRQNITETVRGREGACSMKDVEERWGSKLVIVASQQLRNRALYGREADVNMQLPKTQYCFLERIGRSRRHGEVTNGISSLAIFKGSVKSIFYMKKLLMRRNLVTAQPFNQRVVRGQNVGSSLFHLKRFFVLRKTMYFTWLETLTHTLAQCDRQCGALAKLRIEMGIAEKTFKKLLSLGNKYISRETVSYRTYKPDAPRQEYMCKNKMAEKSVRVLILKKVYTFKLGDQIEEDEEGGSDGGEEDDCPRSSGHAMEGVVQQFDRVYERPMLHQVYAHVLAQGEKGITQKSLGEAFDIGKLESRMLCRNLERHKVVHKFLHDRGRQRVQKYIAHQFIAASQLHQDLEAEKIKIREHSRKQKGGTTCEKDGEETLETPGTRVVSVTKTSTETEVMPENTDTQEKPDVKCMTSLHQVFYDPKDDTCQFQNAKKKSAHVTYRMLRRANIILEAVKEARLIDNIFTIQKKIIDQEFQEGHEYRIDKKSLLRLIERLVKEGQLKAVKTVIECGSGLKELLFVCVPEMASDDPLIQSAIEANKQKTIGLNKVTTNHLRHTKEPGADDKKPARFSTLSALKSNVKVADMEYDPGAGKRYGYVPRMKRIMIVHQYLWYMVNGYGQRHVVPADEVALATSDHTADVQSMGDMMSSVSQMDETGSGAQVAPPDGNKLAEAKENPLRKVYVDDSSWRRFLPPLPKHYGYEDGWCLIGDLLLILPVGLFCQIIRVNFKIKDLPEYLKDPVLRNLCVSQLPVQMRQQLMHERKYIFNFYEVCTYLCQMGLLTFGKRAWREKEQIFVYLHRRASVIDTSSEMTNMAERRVYTYEFKEFQDVEQYWFTLQWICCNTSYEVVKCPTNRVSMSKTVRLPERFVECLRGKSIDEIVDDGSIPGDQEGASGLDSSFWAHLRRNWTFKGVDVRMEAMTKNGHKKMVDGSNRRKKAVVTSSPQKEPPPQPATRRLPKFAGRIVKRGDVAVLGNTPIETVPVKTGELRKGGKGFKRKSPEAPEADKVDVPQKQRRPARPEPGVVSSKSYDDVDEQALHRMTKERVEWSAQEDSMLLLCKVALLFLSSERKHGMLISWCVIRDILHQYYRSAHDKTSKACQRRVMYVMKNPQTRLNVDVYVGEALQDAALVQEYRKGKKYVKTDQEKNAAMFRTLLTKLLKKFKASLSGVEVLLPDTVAEVYRRYNVVRGPKTTVTVHKDVIKERDIYAAVLHNVIHSAMLLNDKTGRDHELYQLFSQYPESLLLEVFCAMKNDGIITRIKKHEHRKFRWNAIPCVSLGNYHVAQRYMYRWFSRYPRNIFINASSFIEQMPEQPEGGSTSGMTNDGEWQESRITGGCTAAVVSLMALGQVRFKLVIPERIIAVDAGRKKGQARSKVAELTLSDEDEEAMLEEAEKRKMSAVTPGESDRDNEMATEVDSGVSSNHDNIGSSSIIFDKRVNIGASRVMLALLREQPLGGASKVIHPTDNIVIKMCNVKLQLKADRSTAPSGGVLPGPDYVLHEILEQWNHSHLRLHPRTQFHILRSLRVQQPASNHLGHVITSCRDIITTHNLSVENMTGIYEEVKGCGVLGITCYQVQQLFCGLRMLDLYVKILLEHRVILQVGVTVFRYVSHEHARPWLIYSLKNVKGRGITDLSDVSEGDDVLELPVGLELPGYFPAKEKSASQAAVATTGDTPVGNASEAGTSQTVSTEDPASGVTDLGNNALGSVGMSDPAMKRQLSETSPRGTPPHKRQHLDTVTSLEQNKDVLQDQSQVSPVEMQTTQSNEAVEVKGQRSIPTVGVTSNKSQLKSPISVQHLVTQQLSVRCKVTPVTLAATAVTVTNNRSQATAKIPATSVARSPIAVMLPATSVARSLTAVKIPATSVTTPPAAVKIQATPVARSPAAVKVSATSVTTSQAVAKIQATPVARSPAAVKVPATPVATSQAAVQIPATSVAKSLAAVKIQATPIARAQAAVKIQATSVARSPAAVKLPATPVARSPAPVKIQATSVARSPAAVKLPATPVARSPAAVKLPATPVARTPATFKIPATSVPSQEMTLDPSILDAITKSGIRGPFRLQLPANLKLPTAGSGQKIRFSVMTKAEAAKLGLGCTMAGTLPPHQPQVTTSQSMTGQTPTKITMPPPAASSSTVVTLPSVQMTHPSKSSSKHPAGGSSVPPFKAKSVTKGSDHKDGNIPQLDGIADDLVDGVTVVKESRQTAFSVDDKLTASCSQAVVDVYGVSRGGPLFGDTSLIPQLDGTVDGETPDTSNKGDSVNTQSDDVTTQSGDVTTQSDDVTTQSGDVTTKSDDVTSREEHHGADKMTQSERSNRPKHPVKLDLGRPDTKSNYRKVRLVARPWKTPEGTVNRPTLKMMLEAVMMFIMTKPGVTKADLAAKYNPLLQPVLLMELTQMLQELGCVKQCIVGRSHKTSVFAPRATLSQVAMDTGEETVTYIPTVDCIIKLGQFEAQLTK